MPVGFNFEVVAIDAERVSRAYDAVAHNVRDLRPGFDRVMELMEDVHARHFRRLRGRYVLTGATKASLTQPVANGAIREMHFQSASFGTQVEQAHYLTKAPQDPNSGQVPKANRPDLKSAVLVFSRTTKKRVADVLLEHATEGFGDA